MKEILGGFRSTTNNRMEMMAVIMGLWELRHHPEVDSALVWSDSKYVVDGIDYARNWAAQGWMTNGGTPAKNKDLWQLMLAYAKKYRLVLQWVRGHAGHEFNERCDQLAGESARLPAELQLIDRGYIETLVKH